jgi:hypothetical protein
LGTNLCSIWWFVFWVFDPFILKGHNFFNYIPFLTIFILWNTLIRGVQFFCKWQKQWSTPLGFALPWMLKCYNCNSIATNEQLKDLTHMLCLWIPCYKLYKKGLFFYVFTLKYMCHFGMSWKKLNLKAKHIKYKIKFHGCS